MDFLFDFWEKTKNSYTYIDRDGLKVLNTAPKPQTFFNISNEVILKVELLSSLQNKTEYP